jgi:hypothetical protein
MIVKEMIEALQKCPQGIEVRMNDNAVDAVVLYTQKVMGGDYYPGDDYVELK